MSFWEKIQKDLNLDKFQKDFKKNIEEGLSIMKEGGNAFTQRIEKITEEGKKKYKVFNLNMKVQEEFAKLGGQVYDLTLKKSKNPMGNRKVQSIIRKINRLENQINKLEMKKIMSTKKKAKSTIKKAASARKKTMTKLKPQKGTAEQ